MRKPGVFFKKCDQGTHFSIKYRKEGGKDSLKINLFQYM